MRTGDETTVSVLRFRTSAFSTCPVYSLYILPAGGNGTAGVYSLQMWSWRVKCTWGWTIRHGTFFFFFFFFLWSTRWKAYTNIRCKLVKTAIYCLILKLYFWRTIEVYNTAWSTAQGACETLSVIIVEIDSEYCDSSLGEHCERKTWYLTNQSEAVDWWQNILKKKIVLYWLFKF